MNWITAVVNLLRQDRMPVGAVVDDRMYSYMLWDSYYDNVAYQSLAMGGQRENINATLGNAAAADLAGLYNPVARAVDLYQHVFGGEFGVDITVESENTALKDPLANVWKWSNINVRKQLLCRFAATNGNCGLRVVFQQHPDPARRRIFIKPEHPRLILDVQHDSRGNVAEILLQYPLSQGVGNDRTVTLIREHQTPDEIRTWRIVDAERTTPNEKEALVPFDTFSLRDNGPGAVVANPLGIVPYVLLAHNPTSETWATNAFYKSISPIDRLNALATHINTQIHRHVRAKTLIAAAGEAPKEIDLSDMTVVYINTRNGTGTPPVVDHLVAPLNLQDSIAQTKALLAEIEDQLPEVKATAGQFLSGQSGETIAQLRRPAEDRLALARINYEDAMIRAQKIALSLGVFFDMWDLGTGQGTMADAEDAYNSGAEDHQFNTRELLPMTPLERNVVAQGMAGDASRAERLRVRGYSPAAIQRIEQEMQAEQNQQLALARKQAEIQAQRQQAQQPPNNPQNAQNPQNGQNEQNRPMTQGEARSQAQGVPANGR